MPARPPTVPTWATDANYPAGSEVWSGTATRVEPNAAQKGTGLVPATRPPAQFLNWIKGLLTDWVAYFAAIIDSNEEHTYQTPKTRTIWIPGGDFQPASLDVVGAATDEQWSIDQNGDPYRRSRENLGVCVYTVSRELPSGGVLTRVDVLVDPGAARGGGLRLTAYVDSYDFPTPPTATTPAAASLGSDEQDAVGHALQYLSITGLSETIVRSDDVVQVRVVSGSEAPGAHTADILYGAFVTFTDPGPRNA